MLGPTIGDWTPAALMRFVINQIRSTQPALPNSMTLPDVTVTKKLTVKDKLELSPQAIQYLKNELGL